MGRSRHFWWREPGGEHARCTGPSHGRIDNRCNNYGVGTPPLCKVHERLRKPQEREEDWVVVYATGL